MAHAEIRSDHHQESKIMGSDSMAARELSDVTIHVRIKFAALWGAVMLCYLYGDVVGFFRQDTMGDIVSGKAGPTMPGAWLYYVFLGSVESCLTILIVWHAWTWPRIAALRQAVG